MDLKNKEKDFRIAGKELGFWKYGYALNARCNMLFGNINFKQKAMLEIGGGKGIFSIWASIHGAKDVINLEPLSDGAFDSADVFSKFYRLKERFGLAQIEMLPLKVQAFECEDSRFDIILSEGSINHLDEESCINLLNIKKARNNYRNIFQKFSRIMKPGGKIIIVDASSRNYYGDRKKTNPFAKKIDWKKHQEPETWASLLEEAGFQHPIITWISPKQLRYLGIYSIPKYISYFYKSAFRLEMTLKN